MRRLFVCCWKHIIGIPKRGFLSFKVIHRVLSCRWLGGQTLCKKEVNPLQWISNGVFGLMETQTPSIGCWANLTSIIHPKWRINLRQFWYVIFFIFVYKQRFRDYEQWANYKRLCNLVSNHRLDAIHLVVNSISKQRY